MPPPPIHSAIYQTISLDKIDLQNEEFRITTGTEDDDLQASIGQLGLISPPVLIKRNSAYVIVSGFRRISVGRKLGWPETLARILDPETDTLGCVRIAIADNALSRPLNLIETSRALHKLSSSISDIKQLSKAAESCGLPGSYSIIHKIKGLCLMPTAIQHGILNDTISLSMANHLAGLEHDDALVFAGLFERFKLSLGKQREIVTLISEIAHRDDLSIGQVLAHDKIQFVLNNEELDRGHLERELRTFLRQWRYPRIVKAENSYNSHLKKLKLGPNIKLTPPREFEGSGYSLTLTFSSLADLKILQSEVAKAARHPSLAEIVEGKISRSQ
jgi:ParB family chromosome partitioning protein